MSRKILIKYITFSFVTLITSEFESMNMFELAYFHDISKVKLRGVIICYRDCCEKCDFL